MITNELILNELTDVKRLLLKTLTKEAESQITEFSLTRTAQLLHMGTETLKSKAENGEIQALTEIVGGVKVYRFLLADIRQYQENRRHIAKPIRSLSGKELFLKIINNGVHK